MYNVGLTNERRVTVSPKGQTSACGTNGNDASCHETPTTPRARPPTGGAGTLVRARVREPQNRHENSAPPRRTRAEVREPGSACR